MKIYNYYAALFALVFVSTLCNAQSRELELEDVDNQGNVIIEMITNDAPTSSTHRNMVLGFNQSNDGFLNMISKNNLSFWTNNERRITITPTGNMGVGISTPLQLLDINGDIGLRDGTGSIKFYEGTAVKAGIDYNGTSIDIETTETASDVILTPADDVILDAGDDILFRSGGFTRMFMNNNGRMGIGITNPAAKLDVRDFSSTGSPVLYLSQLGGQFATLRMTSNSLNEYWDIDARSLTNPQYNIVYNDNGTLLTNLSIDGDGQRTGINNDSPNASMHIKQVGSNIEGLRIENNTDTDSWGFEIGGNDLFLYFNGVQVGNFNDADGVYTSSSDRRLKEDISEFNNDILGKIMQLKGMSYYFKHDKSKNAKSVGFIAQDVREIFPDTVIENDSDESDMLSVKYQDLGVYAIKAIQEQQALILDLQRQINALKKN